MIETATESNHAPLYRIVIGLSSFCTTGRNFVALRSSCAALSRDPHSCEGDTPLDKRCVDSLDSGLSVLEPPVAQRRIP